MGRIEVMETAPALTRGAGLRYIIIFQNESQICSDNCYGPEGGKAVMEPFHIKVAFAPGDIDTAKNTVNGWEIRRLKLPQPTRTYLKDSDVLVDEVFHYRQDH